MYFTDNSELTVIVIYKEYVSSAFCPDVDNL